MSDTDDGFDEEAVRQELREKYGEEDRGETERMSELLLQGATMTNQHCDACGSPIFRYEGQAFCPNCQQAGGQQQAASQQQASGQQRASGQQQAGDEQQASGQQQADSQQQAGDEQPEQAGGQPASDRQQVDTQRDETGRAASDATTDRTADGDAARREQPTRADADSAEQPAAEQPRATGQQQPAAASGEGADALESSIAALARRAAGADDPRTAREYLEAAREAAEALAALRRNA